jgi:hypothetical protein
VEVQWLPAYEQKVPAWLRQVAAEHAAAHLYSGPPRVLTDDELDAVDDPHTGIQSRLDTIKGHRGALMNQVEYAVLESRHLTDTLLRQLPAHVVLSSHNQSAAPDALIHLCGNDPIRWQAISKSCRHRATSTRASDSSWTVSAHGPAAPAAPAAFEAQRQLLCSVAQFDRLADLVEVHRRARCPRA